jgi:hypothetical protein
MGIEHRLWGGSIDEVDQDFTIAPKLSIRPKVCA